MKKNVVIAAFVMCSLPVFAQKVTELKTDKEKLSYSIGTNIAQSLKQQDMVNDVDLNILNQAMNDVFKGQKLLYPEDSIASFMKTFGEKKMAEMQTKMKEMAQKNKEEGAKFLEQNKKKKGVTTTASGLQYEILTKSKSTEKPKETDVVKVKYEGKLLNGTVFDSTDKNNNGEPIEFELNRVIKGWTEGVSLMTKGSKYRLFIPSELAYGESGAGRDITPNSVLIFDVELVDFKSAPQTVDVQK
ncbi:FKBP-type peptidyl-prolyl cis-trans isomerase [Apibacter raozihei]|uniref:FKBP-type peptidyl-prolyl cis-trans isomerase n=1 Tax=Apibacter raozihei TaxID=2500547 RepID=UPI000FE33D27|nr:FKBP-type peptidyl-prolyl cis-trans isomerase [Apibacter raozihei]